MSIQPVKRLAEPDDLDDEFFRFTQEIELATAAEGNSTSDINQRVSLPSEASNNGFKNDGEHTSSSTSAVENGEASSNSNGTVSSSSSSPSASSSMHMAKQVKSSSIPFIPRSAVIAAKPAISKPPVKGSSTTSNTASSAAAAAASAKRVNDALSFNSSPTVAYDYATGTYKPYYPTAASTSVPAVNAAAVAAGVNGAPSTNFGSAYSYPTGQAAAYSSATLGVTPSAEVSSGSEDEFGVKKNHRLRMAAGRTWEDVSLDEWDPNDFRIFCGDLGNEINDDTLRRAFSKYPTFQKARVVRDRKTNKSKGYGFVSFKDPHDYMQAMKEMNGKYLGNRPLKLRKSEWKQRDIEVKTEKELHKDLPVISTFIPSLKKKL